MTNPVLEAIHSRRSVRKFLDRPVEEEKLLAVLRAGQYAPSGGNNQSCHFTVIENPEVLEALKNLATEEFRKMEIKPDTYPSIVHSINASKKGKYDFIFHAPVYVIVSNRREYGNAMADSACALENMMLAAHSLGLGSCWINQLRWLSDNPAVIAYTKELGIGEEEIICGGLALGYPEVLPGTPLPRTGNQITRI